MPLYNRRLDEEFDALSLISYFQVHYPANTGLTVQVPAGEGGAGPVCQADPASDGYLPVLLQLRYRQALLEGG